MKNYNYCLTLITSTFVLYITDAMFFCLLHMEIGFFAILLFLHFLNLLNYCSPLFQGNFIQGIVAHYFSKSELFEFAKPIA